MLPACPHLVASPPAPPPVTLPVTRRRHLLGHAVTSGTSIALALLQAPLPAAVVHAAEPPMELRPYSPQAQIASSPAVANPGVAWTLLKRDKQLFYPEWLQGTWQVRCTFLGASFPQGPRFVSKSVPGLLKGSLIAAVADVGAAAERPVAFRQRFQASEQERGVVADRAFNIRQQVDAFLGYPAVQSVDYSPLDDPTRIFVLWSTPRRGGGGGEDMRQARVFVNNRSGQLLTSEGDNPSFLATELYRQVTQATQQGSIGDYLVATTYTLLDGDHVRARQQVAAFLQPQDPLYFDAHDQAVALYEHEWAMERLPS